MATADRIPTKCEACGKWDIDPKFHYGNRTTHHDCADAEHVAAATALADWHPQHAVAKSVFDACRNDGVKGKDLRIHAHNAHQEHASPEKLAAFEEKMAALHEANPEGFTIEQARAHVLGVSA